MRSLCLAFLLINLSPLVPADSQASHGTVQLYDDGGCTLSKGDLVSLQVNTCLETDQAAGLAALSFPSCGDTVATLYISDLEQCSKSSFSPSTSSGDVGKCLSFINGAGIGSAAFVCVSSVSTVSASPRSQSTSPPPSVQQTAPSSAPPPSVQQTAPPSAPQDSQDNGSHGGGLSHSDKITIAVGVSIGLSALVVAIFQLTPQRIRWPRREGEPDPAPPRYQEFELYHHRLPRLAGLFGWLAWFRWT